MPADPDARPRWGDDVPYCSRGDCPLYGGERCEATGFRPDSSCEPAVIGMADAIRAALGQIDYLRNLHGDEGVTRRVADTLRSALPPEPDAGKAVDDA